MLQKASLFIYSLAIAPFFHHTLYAAALCSPEGPRGLEPHPDCDETTVIKLREKNDFTWVLLVEAYPDRRDELLHRYETYQAIAFRLLNNNFLYEKAREGWLISTNVAMRNPTVKSPQSESSKTVGTHSASSTMEP